MNIQYFFRLALLIILLKPYLVAAQSTPKSEPQIYANFITEEILKQHLKVLTSDSLEGREVGTPGNDKAARYIAREFGKLKLEAIGDNQSYMQGIYLTSYKWDHLDLTFNSGDFRNLFDYIALPSKNADIKLNYNEIVYAGFGIDDPKYSDYRNLNVEGKVILIYEGEPHLKGKSVITGSATDSPWSAEDNELKLRTAGQKGAAYVLIVKAGIQKMFEKNRGAILGNEMVPTELNANTGSHTGHAYISTEVLKNILGKKANAFISKRNKALKKARPFSMSFAGDFKIDQKRSFKDVKSNNILGFLRGADPKLSEEVLIITAHMDHLGKRGDYIYRGADDDGSGTSSVMAMARAFTKAAENGFRPARSILFMLVTGEEKGLYGSKYYTTFPVLPLEKTVADLNIDMIGRIDPKHMESADSNYIYLIGSDRISTDLHELSESVNARFSNLKLDYTYNSDKDPNRFYYRSDHYNFAEKGIPIIFYFSGVHEDYHKPSDTIEKIHFNLLKKRAQLVFYTAWEIANRPERIQTGTNKKE